MYILEGTIGAGKSIFLKLLSEHLPHSTVKLEPVDTWQSQENGNSLLANFYENPKRWAYTLETFTMISRVKEHTHDQISTRPTIVERSIYSGHYVFARNSYESGFMTETEWNIYNQFFNFLTKSCHVPQGFIYLKVSPHIAYERIKKRKRSAESTLPLDYLYQIDKQHEKFLIKKEDILPNLKNVPILTLDCNQEFEHDSEQFSQFCNQIQDFLEETNDTNKNGLKDSSFQKLVENS